MEIRVPSVRGRDVCYLLRAEREDYSSRDGLHWSIYEFDTYGDGDVQHAPEHRMFDVENWADALMSLAPTIIQTPDEYLGKLVRAQPSAVSDKLILWAATVRYDENKFRYYSLADMKVSTTESKRHDRRWSPVPNWADGSALSATRLLGTDGESPLDFMIRLDTVERIMEDYGALVRWTHEKLNRPDPNFPSHALRDAVRCYAEAWQVIAGRHAVRRMTECWHNNYIRKEESSDVERNPDRG